MATQKISSSTELISVDSLSYVRKMVLSINVSKMKPNTRIYPFFGGVDVSRYITPTGGLIGSACYTSASGVFTGTFSVPGKTFPAGTIELMFSDVPTYISPNTLGASSAFCRADFTSAGVLKRFQTTVTTTTYDVVYEQNVNISAVDNRGGDGGGDPLAQSFFTYGVTGGCFITSIGVFFASVSDTTQNLPVWVELREMVNGYPSSTKVNQYARAILHPTDITTSTNASVETKFTFDRPIYLKENSDYCFVLQSNSGQYNVYTSKMGEVSNETGKVVFEQPYSGSMFKSENNKTWTAEQNEDLKFVLYKASYVNADLYNDLEIKMSANSHEVVCSNFSTEMNSADITVVLPFKHKFTTNSRFRMLCDAAGTYNGISGSDLNNTQFPVSEIISEYSFKFSTNLTGASLTPITAGKILTGGRIKDIIVLSSSTNFTTVPVISISAPDSGTDNATATAVISDGKLVDIIVTNQGAGYLNTPAVTLSTGSATFSVITDETFIVGVNREYHGFNPNIFFQETSGTKINSFLGTYKSTGLLGKEFPVNLGTLNTIQQDSTLFSKDNESFQLGGNQSATLRLSYEYTSGYNSNVSPVIDLNNSRAKFYANSINTNSSELISVIDTVSTNTETLPNTSVNVKLAQTRYISKPQILSVLASGINLYVSAYSGITSSFSVYYRISNSGNSDVHDECQWAELSCDSSRNKSSTSTQIVDYKFYAYNLTKFDTVSLKFVLFATNKFDPPIIKNYRAIFAT